MFSDLSTLKLLSIILVFAVALLAGGYPFFLKRLGTMRDFATGQALASGVFLGSSLMHMLADANADFNALHYTYPIAYAIAGGMVLVFLALEHIGREMSDHDHANSCGFAVIATLMLSIHSLFAGAALGLSGHVGVVITLLLAILAHKWAASFALATQINRSHLTTKMSMTLFLVFAIMTPLGIFGGDLIATTLSTHSLIQPIFNAIAAGTFLYLGTLHGLSRSFMIDRCCGLKNFLFVILGFTLMAVVAIWT